MNTFGNNFAITTFGESHGAAIGVVVDGCPSGIELSEDDINLDLARRAPSGSVSSTTRREADLAQIVSGVYNGRTTGTPITILIQNTDVRSTDYDKFAKIFRPGHADFTYHHKYGNRDHRGGGRASGRETAARVAAGAVAKKYLQSISKIDIFGYVTLAGDKKATSFDRDFIDSNPFRTADREMAADLEGYLAGIRAEGNSVGGVVELCIDGTPIGLGEPVFDKLDARLAYAFMGIPAVKGVEIGDGFAVAGLRGSENNDQITSTGFLSNHAGGVLGGISTGQRIFARIAVKPTPSIAIPQRSIDLDGNELDITVGGRHDVFIAPRIVPVVEAMAYIVLADFWRIYA
ncbi:MAG: chorismate synthase [Deferribacteraceae bacterium]|jgi:chorismate synthase|nr:chorismate synthase [Deferribacteraceae bacterium]